MTKSIGKLQEEYYSTAPLAIRFATSLKEEIEELLLSKRIPLGVPLEYRVKKFESISEKIKRKSLKLDKIIDIPDLIGLRLILLFSRDVIKACDLLSNTFTVLHKEDTQARLGESQFGYQSFHYLIQLPDNWLSVPSFASTGNFKAEIQIRTLAQHIWAASSHVLQYKQESSVPLPVRRSIHRVSALLETIDLEFERVLEARESYISEIDINEDTESLNVDLLASVLDRLLPPANKEVEEHYADLLPDLLHFGISTPKELQILISKHLQEVLKHDAERVQGILEGEEEGTNKNESRLKRGVFFTHVGLTRQALVEEIGSDKYSEYFNEKKSRKTVSARKKSSTKKGA